METMISVTKISELCAEKGKKFRPNQILSQSTLLFQFDAEANHLS